MNFVDGRKIAADISAKVAADILALGKVPKLTVVACDPNFETRKYLSLKQSKAEALGIKISVVILPKEATTEEVIAEIKKDVSSANGIVVQLPLPSHIDTKRVLASVPDTHDVDAFNYQNGTALVLPPVVGAIDEISKSHNLDWIDKNVAIFGAGRLVGAPAKYYAEKRSAKVSLITENSEDAKNTAMSADIIILGVGRPNLLTGDMVREGVVVFDAGASEDGGLLVGDASSEVAQKASLFTPVPGGIGPITIALLFRNLLDLSSRQ